MEIFSGDDDTSPGGTLRIDRFRHFLLSVRLRKIYFIYCGVCCLMSGVACSSTYHKIAVLSRSGQSLTEHSWDCWEVHLELAIGLAVLMESLISFRLMGVKTFFKDWLCIFDLVVATATLLSWVLLAVKQTFLADDILEFDLPVLVLRFVLQPFRMLSTASALRRVHLLQQHTRETEMTVDLEIDITPTTLNSKIFTREMKTALMARLPSWCRFKDWQLSYAPHIHGTSFQTFYRSQLTAVGPHILLMQTASGTNLGCFCTEPWRQNTRGYRASQDSFLFASCTAGEFGETDEKSGLVFYHARAGQDDILLWCDETTISFAGALVISKEFGFCDSYASQTFGSPPLDEHGDGFRIVLFECWNLSDEIAE